MKKSLIIITLGLLFLITSCSQENEALANLPGDLEASIIELDQLHSAIDDPRFWESAMNEVALVTSATETEQPITVVFRLKIGKSSKAVSYSEQATLIANTDDARQFFANQLACGLASSDLVIHAYDSNQTVQVTGIMINWSKKAKCYKKDLQDYSVCDLDADGKWDYVCKGTATFTSMPHIVSLDYEIAGVDVDALVETGSAVTLSELEKN